MATESVIELLTVTGDPEKGDYVHASEQEYDADVGTPFIVQAWDTIDDAQWGGTTERVTVVRPVTGATDTMTRGEYQEYRKLSELIAAR